MPGPAATLVAKFPGSTYATETTKAGPSTPSSRRSRTARSSPARTGSGTASVDSSPSEKFQRLSDTVAAQD